MLGALMFQILLSSYALMNVTVHPSVPCSINSHHDLLCRLLDSLRSVDGFHFSCWVKAAKSSRCSGHMFMNDSSVGDFLNRVFKMISGFDVVNKDHILSSALNISISHSWVFSLALFHSSTNFLSQNTKVRPSEGEIPPPTFSNVTQKVWPFYRRDMDKHPC